MSRRSKHKRDELGPDSAGQSGDIQQLSDAAGVDSESVEELAEEGNAFEAEAVQGVEDAKPPDVAEVPWDRMIQARALGKAAGGGGDEHF